MIISKEKDYYDWAFYTFNDPKIKYERKEHKSTIPKGVIEKYTSSYSDVRRGTHKILTNLEVIRGKQIRKGSSLGTLLNTVGAEWIYGNFVSRGVLIIGNSIKFIYRSSTSKLISSKPRDVLTTYTFYSDFEDFKEKNPGANYELLGFERHEPTPQELSEFVKEVREHDKSPIILVFQGATLTKPAKQDKINKLLNGPYRGISDINIKELNLKNPPDAMFILNEITMFLGSLNAESGAELPEDKYIIESKGFNKESFRNRPKDS